MIFIRYGNTYTVNISLEKVRKLDKMLFPRQFIATSTRFRQLYAFGGAKSEVGTCHAEVLVENKW